MYVALTVAADSGIIWVMLTIRLQRVGRKNQPVFRIVLAEKYRAASKKAVEALGTYNPRNKEFSVKEGRVKYWLEKHIQLSPTVHNLFVAKKLISDKKIKAWQPKKKEKAPEAASAPVASAEAKPENPAAA